MSRRLVVVSGGLRNPSSSRLLADQLAAATVAALAATDGAEPTAVEVIELREHAHDITNNLLTGFATPELQSIVDSVATADGLIAVSPVFSASYGGLFKSFFDILDEASLVDKPVLLGATGGTPRHSLAIEHALRPLFAYLRALVVPTGVYAATDDFAGDGLRVRIERAGAELARLMLAYTPPAAPDPFALTTSFEDLLK
jgi:FMN reductase